MVIKLTYFSCSSFGKISGKWVIGKSYSSIKSTTLFLPQDKIRSLNLFIISSPDRDSFMELWPMISSIALAKWELNKLTYCSALKELSEVLSSGFLFKKSVISEIKVEKSRWITL